MNKVKSGLRRKSLRLQNYDYTSSGAYSVTICSYQRENILGEINNDQVSLSEVGQIVRQVWKEIPEHYENVQLDEFVIMPNHVHGILFICDQNVEERRDQDVEERRDQDVVEERHDQDVEERHDQDVVEERHASPLLHNNGSKRPSLGNIVGSFKSACTKQINLLRRTPGEAVWQRSYFERIVRNDYQLGRIRDYIKNNPLNWALDRKNQNVLKQD
jgi:putative transposase